MELNRPETLANYTIHLVNGLPWPKLVEIAEEHIHDMLINLTDDELVDQISESGIIEFLDDKPTTDD